MQYRLNVKKNVSVLIGEILYNLYRKSDQSLRQKL